MSLLDLYSWPFKFIRLSIYLQFMLPMKNGFLFLLFLQKVTIIMRVIYWHFSLEYFRGISSISIRFPKIIIPNILRVFPITRAKVYLYSIFIYKDKKTKFISNPFLLSIFNDCYAFILAWLTNHVTSFNNVCPIEVIWFW